jgi:uncharacterized membrane protein YccC
MAWPLSSLWAIGGSLSLYLQHVAFDKAGRLAAVALSIIVLVKIDNGPAQAAIGRFLEVGFGIVVALVVTMLVFPPHRASAEAKATI